MKMRSDEHMIDAIEGTLKARDRAQFKEVLAENSAVLREINELADIKAQVQRLPEIGEPVDFTTDVMKRIDEINHPWWIRLRHFLLRKHSYQVTVLGGMTGAVASVATVILGVTLIWPSTTPQTVTFPDVPQQYLMRFSYNNPQANQVFVAGSFNDWRKDQVPMTDTNGNGLWVGVLQVEPGIHEYMFYVDGQWVTDEHAQRFKDDGFGRRNAILQLSVHDDISI